MDRIRRRTFFRQSGKLALAAGAVTLPGEILNSRGSMGPVFVHHVFFWLKDPSDQQDKTRFEKAMNDLVSIDVIRQFHLGKPADTRREVIDSSYQYSLLTLFDGKAEHDSYQVHPVHDAFRVVAGELCSRVLVYDSVDMDNEK